MPTVKFFPDAHIESTSVDGVVSRQTGSPGEAFSTIRNGAGTNAQDGSSPDIVGIHSRNTDLWDIIYRPILLVDTSSIPPSAPITLATFNIHISSHFDQFAQTYAINVFSSTPASNIALVAADYSQLGTTPLATKKTIDSLANDTWETFTFNAAGIAAINKGGITKLGLREANFDAPNTTPTWEGPALSANVSYKSADNPDSTLKPYLEVTYPSYATAGFNWIDQRKEYYGDANNEKRSIEGTDTGVNATGGFSSIDGTYYVYIDGNGDKRRQQGYKLGATGKTPGFVSIAGSHKHYIDAFGDERYLPIGAGAGAEIFNKALFNG